MSLTNQDQHPLIAAAREWYEAGYCVVPAHEDGGKRPWGLWKQYQSERLPIEEVEALLGTGNYTGIGVITGHVSHNVEMIELEGRAVRNGSLDFLRDIAKHNNMSELLDRLIHGCSEISPNVGHHFFARCSDTPIPDNHKLARQPNRETGEIEVLSETRGEGGFVIVAPSPGRKGHPDGMRYIFWKGNPANTPIMTGEELRQLRWLFSHLDDMPEEKAQRVKAPKVEMPHAVDGLTPWTDWANQTTWAQILEPHGWQFMFAGQRDGHPNDTWCRPNKKPSDGPSATTAGENGPMYVFTTSSTLPSEKGMSKLFVYAHYNHNDDMSAAASALSKLGYGVSYDDLAPWEYVPDVKEAEASKTVLTDDNATEWVVENMKPLNWHDLWADETEEEWIVWPLLPARRLVALYSAPKVGKSLLMLELAAGVATGKPVLGFNAEPRKILYVDFENDPVADVRERLQAMQYKPEELGNLFYLSFPSLSALDSERGSKELLATALHFNVEAIFIDTVSRSVAGEENENDTWLKFYRHTGLKLKQAQIALMRLDHSGKDESKGQRGGSAKVGDVDAVWRMKRSSDGKDLFVLDCEAHRFQLSEPKLTIRRQKQPLCHVAVGGGSNSTYIDAIERIAQKLDALDAGHGEEAMRKALKEAGLADNADYVLGERNGQKIKAIQNRRKQPSLSNWPGGGSEHESEQINAPSCGGAKAEQ
jgi:hypothetical protein